MRRAEKVKALAARRLDALSRLDQPPAMPDPAPLADLVDRMETLAARVEKGRGWMTTRRKELEEMAGRIAANPSHAVRMTKRLMRESVLNRLDSVLELAAVMQALSHQTADHREAVTAFLEKRAPVFKA